MGNFQVQFFKLLTSNAGLMVLNLGRDMAIAAVFGTSALADAFFLAISLPVFLVAVAGGSFRSLAVPLLSSTPERGTPSRQQVARRMVQLNMAGILIVAAVLAVAAVAVKLAPLPGVSESARTLFAGVFLAVLPSYACAAMVEISQGPLQVSGRYFLPNLVRLGSPLGIALGALYLSDGTSIFGVAMGGFAGALLAMLAIMVLLARDRVLPTGNTERLPAAIASGARAGYVALIVGACITNVNPLIAQWMASYVGQGAVSSLGYSSRLTVGIGTLVAGSLTPVALHRFSTHAAANDQNGINSLYAMICRLGSWVGCFATLASWLSAQMVIALLYQRGKFHGEDVRTVATLMNCYALQYPIYWGGVGSFTLISALSLNSFFPRLGIILFIINIVAGITLIQFFGVYGIAFTTVLVMVASLLIMHAFLTSSGRLDLGMRDILRALVPLALLAVLGGLMWVYGIGISFERSAAANLAGVAILAVFTGCGVLANRPVLRGLLRPG